VKRAISGLAVGMLLTSAPAAAGEPVYFHKPNVERDAFAADLAYCLDLAKGVRAPAAPYVYTPNLYAAVAAGFFAGIMRSRERRHMIDSVLRTCMADKGYRRIEATKALGKELDRLSENERTERFYALAGTPEPIGEVLPQ
jgi:hypothetical protein